MCQVIGQVWREVVGCRNWPVMRVPLFIALRRNGTRVSTQALSTHISSLSLLLVQTHEARWKAAVPEQLTGTHVYLNIAKSGCLFHCFPSGLGLVCQQMVWGWSVNKWCGAGLSTSGVGAGLSTSGVGLVRQQAVWVGLSTSGVGLVYQAAKWSPLTEREELIRRVFQSSDNFFSIRCGINVLVCLRSYRSFLTRGKVGDIKLCVSMGISAWNDAEISFCICVVNHSL